MPTISLFYGIVIAMYYEDHMPPHFHARYQDYEASYGLDGEVIAGALPPKQAKLVAAWAVARAEDLQANWEIARDNGELFRIDPLR